MLILSKIKCGLYNQNITLHLVVSKEMEIVNHKRMEYNEMYLNNEKKMERN